MSSKIGVQNIAHTNGTVAATIDSSGNATFSKKLTVTTSDSGATPSVHSDDLFVEGSGNSGITVGSGTSGFGNLRFADSGGSDQGIVQYDHANDAMKLFTNGSERIRIDNAGNVGIGNSNPTDFGSLTDNLVIGTTSGENGMTIASGTGNSGRIQFADNTASPFRGAIEYSHGNDHLFFYTAGSQRLKITNGGFIQSPPTASNTTGSGANMHVTAGGEFAKSTSSKRYKNNINDATHGLTELLKLRSVTYKGNNDGDIIFGGLIAEEVHDAGLTEFVQYDDENKPESLHYTHMVALCVKAIQELSAKNNALEARIAKLEGA